MNIKSLLLILLIVLFIINYSCEKQSTNPAKPPEVTTAEVSAINYTYALCGGTIHSEGDSQVLTNGVCWSTNEKPKWNYNDNTLAFDKQGDFKSEMIGLIPETKYYVRAYATNEHGTGYGEEKTFTTKAMQSFTDKEGNTYKIVEIGDQWWMAENLQVTQYRNGDPIACVSNKAEWNSLSTGAYCFYDYQENPYGDVYGKLYNWYAVTDSRNIAPDGWHVPGEEEWQTLMNFLGGASIAGGKLKETGLAHWASYNTGATNETGFTALPGGSCGEDGGFGHTINLSGCFWSSTKEYRSHGTAYQSYGYHIYFYSNDLNRNAWHRRIGCSIRCVKD